MVRKKQKPSLITFVLDRSGSMQFGKEETIGAFNAFLKSQQDLGESRWTFFQFDSVSIDTLYENEVASKVLPLNDKTYEPRGGTPLYDAVIKAIESANAVANQHKDVTIVVQTDGMENASTANLKQVQELVKKAETDGYQFVFLGRDLDAWGVSQGLGINSGYAMSYTTGTSDVAYAAASAAVSTFRSTGERQTGDFTASPEEEDSSTS